ncbi:MAG: hypothetical protein U0R80_12545 [Nocardioidaceae bacterium]
MGGRGTAKRAGAALAAAAAVCVLGGCTEHREPSPAFELTGSWKLTDAVVEGHAFESLGGRGPTLALFDTDSGQAIAGCLVSEVRATARTDRRVTFAARKPSSMRSCPPLADDPTDGAYLEALRLVDHGDLAADDSLTLTGPDVRLHFVALRG